MCCQQFLVKVLPRVCQFSSTFTFVCVVNWQVVVPLASEIAFESNSLVKCSLAAQFVDIFAGLYGPERESGHGAYLVTFGAPWNEFVPNYYGSLVTCPYFASTLQFGCVSCPPGTYSLAFGYSNGTAGNAVNPACTPCPFGGVCSGASQPPVPQPGYWGQVAGSGNVSFAVCPSSYCCSDLASCTATDSCHGSRSGPLCGDFPPGFTESLDSTSCVPTSHCGRDMQLFWPLAVLGIFIAAAVQLIISNLISVKKSANVSGDSEGHEKTASPLRLHGCVQDVKRCPGRCLRRFRCLSWCSGSKSCLTRKKLQRDQSAAGTEPRTVTVTAPDPDLSSKFKVFTYFLQVLVRPHSY